jgi:hypothetical protein
MHKLVLIDEVDEDDERCSSLFCKEEDEVVDL